MTKATGDVGEVSPATGGQPDLKPSPCYGFQVADPDAPAARDDRGAAVGIWDEPPFRQTPRAHGERPRRYTAYADAFADTPTRRPSCPNWIFK